MISTTLVETASLYAGNAATRVFTLIGGGGKTGLMFLWASLLKAAGFSVVTTTTTRLAAQLPAAATVAMVATAEQAARAIRHSLPHQSGQFPVLVSSHDPTQGKLIGIPAEWLGDLCLIFPETFFLVEGDGSAGRSLKGYSPHEPVIPACTSVLLPVLGIDALGARLEPSMVHRPEIFSRTSGLALGSTVTMQAIITALFHPDGPLRDAPKAAAILPVINKAETETAFADGTALARKILAAGQFQHPLLREALVGSVKENTFVRIS